MGSGASKKAIIKNDNNSSQIFSTDSTSNNKTEERANRREKAKRLRLYGTDTYDAVNGTFNLETRQDFREREVKSPEVVELLTASLRGFFIFSSDANKIDTVIAAMTREDYRPGDFLMIEGDPGMKLYIVSSGRLEVTINGEIVRVMETGAIIGELALLYDAPRSASVKCLCDVTVWALSRDVFRNLQAANANLLHQERARWLVSCDSLAGLSPVELSRLMNVMQVRIYNQGNELYLEGVASMKFMLVLKGTIGIYSSLDPTGISPHQLDKTHCILRPNTNKALSERIILPSHKENCNDDDDDCANLAKSMSDDGLRAPIYTTPLGSSRKVVGGISTYLVTDVSVGCLLGFGTMRGKGGLTDAWVWKPGAGGVSTFLAVVKSNTCECLEFTLDVFERLFSTVETAIIKRVGTTKISTRINDDNELKKFDQSKFVIKHSLGSGSFGSVSYALYEGERYALKTLGKAHLLDTGQLRHVLDEKKLLSSMKCPFILKLYGTYQTPHKLVFVTEVLECGDLWGAIHEEDSHVENNGLSLSLVVFYSASLVVALAHIHEKGIAYRDLKPENIMLDSKGYLRIIDFGFAKIIPYVETNSNGITEIRSKSYTLCGTPEYLAPEFVCNFGHDASVDLWALGVVIYEMFLSITPFAARRPDNVTELFTNIANTKKTGVKLSPSLDIQSRGTLARDLILNLLKPEPAERLGIRQGSTRYVLEHDFFENIDIASLTKGKVIPPYVPAIKTVFDDDDDMPAIRPYHGNQKLFENF